MERHEEKEIKWLIDKPGGLFLTRRSGTLRRVWGRKTDIPRYKNPFNK